MDGTVTAALIGLGPSLLLGAATWHQARAGKTAARHAEDQLKPSNGKTVSQIVEGQSTLLVAHTQLDELRFQEMNAKLDLVLGKADDAATMARGVAATLAQAPASVSVHVEPARESAAH